MTTTHAAALQAQQNAIAVRVQQMNASVSLVRATGGGWTRVQIDHPVLPMRHSTLKRVCMRDNIREVLIARILDGTYPAGTQLKELYLAREFDVSQAPIREALRELEGSGLVTCERFRGTRVRGADFKEMRESYELRMILEVAGRADRGALPGRAHRRAGDRSCARWTRPSRPATRSATSTMHCKFHRRLMESSGNRAFLSVWDSLLWDVRGRIALRRLAERGWSLRPLVGMHRALLARLRAQDARGAARRCGRSWKGFRRPSRTERAGKAIRSVSVSGRRADEVLLAAGRAAVTGKGEFRQHTARIHGAVAFANLEMHVRSGRMPGAAKQREEGALCDVIALMNLQLAVVRIQ